MKCGRKITVAVNPVPYVLEIVSESDDNHQLVGFEGKLLHLILTALGCDFDLRYPADKEWGDRKSDGNWTGMIGMVRSGKADLAFTDIAVTQHRMEVVSFSTSYSIDEYTFAIERSRIVNLSFAFLKPFTFNVWMCLICALILMTVVFYFIKEEQKSMARIFLGFCSSVLRQPLVLSVNDTKWKLLISIWFMFALVISCSYSSTLLSFLSFPLQSDTVRNFRELSAAVQRGTHQCFMVRGDVALSYLIQSKEQHLKILGEAVQNHGWFFDTSETANRNHLSSTTAEFHLKAQAELFYATDRKVILSDDNLYSVPIAVVANKEFCCLRKLNAIVSRTNSGGFYKKFLDDESFMFFLLSSKDTISKSVAESITVDDIFGPLMLLCISHLFSTLVLLGEIAIKKYSTK